MGNKGRRVERLCKGQSQETVDKIRQLFEVEGFSVAEISTKLGIGTNPVYAIIGSWGFQRKGHLTLPDDQRVKVLCDELLEGSSARRDICIKYGLNPDYLNHISGSNYSAGKMLRINFLVGQKLQEDKLYREIRDLWVKGYRIEDISIELGKSVFIIRNLIKRFNGYENLRHRINKGD